MPAAPAVSAAVALYTSPRSRSPWLCTFTSLPETARRAASQGPGVSATAAPMSTASITTPSAPASARRSIARNTTLAPRLNPRSVTGRPPAAPASRASPSIRPAPSARFSATLHGLSSTPAALISADGTATADSTPCSAVCMSPAFTASFTAFVARNACSAPPSLLSALSSHSRAKRSHPAGSSVPHGAAKPDLEASRGSRKPVTATATASLAKGASGERNASSAMGTVLRSRTAPTSRATLRPDVAPPHTPTAPPTAVAP
mmetsp:Transcript_1603/g.5530  ORF Transcript_1603/g.5530 Transcript_1603/m.5530 type:complete len:261 (+) Transcript_1603:463-1245(+)